MKTIQYLGGIHALAKGEEDIYLGHDNGQPVNLTVDEATDVSDEKADQLASDFPSCFEIDGKTVGKRPKLALVPDADDENDAAELGDEAEADDETETVDAAAEPEQESDDAEDAAEPEQESDGDLAGQLMAHSRADLNAVAKKLKIKDPDKLPNKAAVVDAIVAAKASAGA